MPGFLTDYGNNKLLDLVFGGVAVTPETSWHVGLSLTAANKAGSVSEPAGGSYARVLVANNLTNFPTAASGAKQNATVFTFPPPTGNWGTILSFFWIDGSSNVWATIDLPTSLAILSGASAPKIAVGAFFMSHT